VSAIDADLIVACGYKGVRDLRRYLLSADRVQAVVGLARSLEADEPVLDVEGVRALVGAGPRIYYLPDAHALRRLQGSLGQRLALTAGGVRVWWPGLVLRGDPGEHPLVLALDGEPQADVLAEFERQFNLSRPTVRGEIRLIEDARRLAEYECTRALARARQAERALLEAARSRESGRGEEP
jgi:hypothetical protein